MSKALIVPGHSLVREGAAHYADGRIKSVYYYAGVGGSGCGKCSCGALSEVLPSAAKRKRWHREHKADVLDQQARQSLGKWRGGPL